MIALAKPQLNSIDEVIHGEALAVLRTLPDNSVDAIVCDPPAGISFMNKTFDSDRGGRDFWIAWLRKIMAEALRVLKPGGHAFVWALPRTSHWTGIALEDAGFEVRDAIFHHYGSGFPKSHNLGDGRGTALKPSTEIWWLCRKPLSEKSIAENVLKWGTGAINIAATRVGTSAQDAKAMERCNTPGSGRFHAGGGQIGTFERSNASQPLDTIQGRWPSNLLLSHSVWCVPNGVKKVKCANWRDSDNERPFDPMFEGGWKDRQGNHYADSEGLETVEDWLCDESCPVRLLDEQSGMSKTRPAKAVLNGAKSGNGKPASGVPFVGGIASVGYQDQGGSSRYFQRFYYVSKASRAERNRGCEGLPEQAIRINAPRSSEGEKFSPSPNNHPTVKPLQLMRYLVRMITPPGGIVLDCFAGSGSTLVAAIHEGMHFIGIEMNDSEQEPYVTIARARIEQAFRDAGKPDVPVPPAEEWDCVEDCPVRLLDEQSGVLHARGNKTPTKRRQSNGAWGMNGASFGIGPDGPINPGDQGGASRFFTNLVQDGIFDEVQHE